ncbi:MAG: S1 RNA-binding domain-containing protein [Acidobacteria bacterium]|nr:S1 RNA-binding domain-containing protein [Acidobacteriota bacterium]
MNPSNPIDSNIDETPATPAEESFADILSEFEREHSQPASHSRSGGGGEGESGGGSIEGTVISVSPAGVFVDIGRKLEGILPLEAAKNAMGGQLNLKAGDPIKVSVGGRDENGYCQLSTFKIVLPKDWSGLEKAFADKATITGTVEEAIKGGLRVDVGARAFLPASRSGARDQAEMEKLIGQQIECRITKLDVAKEDVVVDRRGLLEERANAAKAEAFGSLVEGSVMEGTVRSVMEFGAFVDLGGVDGLVHVTEMTWERGVKPGDVVKSGDRVQVKIVKIDREKRKIALGMKQLQPDPWTVALSEIQAGQRIRGKVVRLTDFGAFVELRPGVEGMIHVSEMTWTKKQKRPQDIVKVGEVVEVDVIGVKPEDKRIGLSLKQALGDPWAEAKQKYPKGSIVEAAITSVANFGAFVDLGNDIEGMIHVGDITNEKRLEHPKEKLAVGQVIKAQVTELDDDRRRVRLSMKTLEPTSADEYIAEHKVGDEVTGRVIETHPNSAKVELAEGVKGVCRVKVEEKTAAASESKSSGGGSADVSSLSAMLSAKWKSGSVGGGGASSSAAVNENALRQGQVRKFRIVALHPEKKQIELEIT